MKQIYIILISGGDWTPHKVEMAIWTYYVLRENKPELLDALPEPGADADRRVVPENGEIDTNISNS